MSFWIAGAILVTTVKSGLDAKKAREKGQRDAVIQAAKDAKQARKAEVFAETEGDGIGQMGKISLEVDDEVIDEQTDSLRI
jgi:hypothetical protein